MPYKKSDESAVFGVIGDKIPLKWSFLIHSSHDFGAVWYEILPVFRPLTTKNPFLVVWFGVIFFPRVKPYSLDGTKWPFALHRSAHAYDSPAQVPCIRSVPLL